jgi:hypothetical protein
MAPRIEMLETAARLKAPEMRSRVQLLISRLRLEPSLDSPKPHSEAPPSDGAAGVASSDPHTRSALGRGSHPEVELIASELRLRGIADLVTVTEAGCSITDYKTGEVDDGHVEQLRDYALLWTLDHDRNPTRLPIDGLTISYVSHAETVAPPSAAERTRLAAELTNRVEAADRAVERRPPEARPDSEVCPFCSVRHMCEVYWRESADALTLLDGSFGDVELRIHSRHSGRAWNASSTRTNTDVLLRVQNEAIEFAPNSSVRILRVSISIDPASDVRVATMTKGSEVYLLGADTESV